MRRILLMTACLLFSACAKDEVVGTVVDLSKTASGAVHQAADTIENAIDDVKDRVDKVQSGVDLLMQGKELIQDGMQK